MTSQGSAVNATVCPKGVSSLAPSVAEDVLIVDGIQDAVLSLASLAPGKNNKWRLSDGNLKMSATINDTAFLIAHRNNREFFSKRDSLICRLRIRQWQTAKGLRSEYEVMEVTKHLRPTYQICLP